MTVMHSWAFEVTDQCDRMRCGLLVYLDANADIIGDHDFRLGVDKITCPDCVAAIADCPTATLGELEKQ